jgi:hypothetical protein
LWQPPPEGLTAVYDRGYIVHSIDFIFMPFTGEIRAATGKALRHQFCAAAKRPLPEGKSGPRRGVFFATPKWEKLSASAV